MLIVRTFFCIIFVVTTSLFSSTYKLNHQENNPWPGFFSVFNTVLGALNSYDKAQDKHGFIVDFEDQGFFYDPKLGPNWWDYYFEPIQIEPLHEPEIKFKTYKTIVFSFYAQLKMARERGHELIQKYIKIKPHIQKKVDTFVQEYFNGNMVIGIHYRATDKVTEAPLVDYQSVKDLLAQEIQSNDQILLFIATDDEKFLQYMYQQFPGRIVATNALRSSDGNAVHSDLKKSPYQKGEEALIDCLLLAQCSKLYKTASNLSDAAIKFNPTIPVVSLSSHYTENTRYARYNGFKVLSTILVLLYDFENNKTTGFTAYFPTHDGNWWDNLFNPVIVGDSHPNLKLTDADLTILGFTGLYELDPTRAHELLTKYIRIKPHILKKVEELYTKKLLDSHVISVFYMKDSAEDYQNYNTFIFKTRQILNKAPSNKKILLITNDQLFLKLMNTEFSGIIINPILSSWNLADGEADLLFCLLMARSQQIIGSRSTYLNTTQQFNPEVPIIPLGKYWLEN
jgi:hypothetical protein